jgi:membrane associated rhomboid family serine protease
MARKSKVDWVEIAIVVPVLILVGMYVVGTVLDGFLGTKNMFAMIFAGVGGVGVIIFYYKVVWDKARDYVRKA